LFIKQKKQESKIEIVSRETSQQTIIYQDLATKDILVLLVIQINFYQIFNFGWLFVFNF